MTKRKLKLLSEVLPDPRASKPAGPTPRERTARRLQQLLSIAAAGVLSAPGCGSDQSSSGYMVVDPMPTPVCSMGTAKLSVSAKWERVQQNYAERYLIHLEVVAEQPTSFDSEATPVKTEAPLVSAGELVTWSSSGQSFVAVVALENTQGGLSINFQVRHGGWTRATVLLMLQGPEREAIVSDVCLH